MEINNYIACVLRNSNKEVSINCKHYSLVFFQAKDTLYEVRQVNNGTSQDTQEMPVCILLCRQ